MTQLIVYSRQGCHLCELLIEELLPMLQGRAELQVCDIDSRDDWREAYDLRVPVVELNGETLCQYSLDRDKILQALSGLAERG